METSSHEVHETSPGRDDRHHFAELQQVAAACDDEVALEAVRFHPEQLLEVTGREREGVCFRESAARFECSLKERSVGAKCIERKGRTQARSNRAFLASQISLIPNPTVTLFSVSKATALFSVNGGPARLECDGQHEPRTRHTPGKNTYIRRSSQ